MREQANSYGNQVGYRMDVEGEEAPRLNSGPVPGPVIVLTRGEPVEITLINRNDGIHGYSLARHRTRQLLRWLARLRWAARQDRAADRARTIIRCEIHAAAGGHVHPPNFNEETPPDFRKGTHPISRRPLRFLSAAEKEGHDQKQRDKEIYSLRSIIAS